MRPTATSRLVDITVEMVVVEEEVDFQNKNRPFELDASDHVSAQPISVRVAPRLRLSAHYPIMALPQSLRVSVTPPELELIASQQLIEIIPLISMERTAFISVHAFTVRLA